jgi:hypothetical protein
MILLYRIFERNIEQEEIIRKEQYEEFEDLRRKIKKLDKNISIEFNRKYLDKE